MEWGRLPLVLEYLMPIAVAGLSATDSAGMSRGTRSRSHLQYDSCLSSSPIPHSTVTQVTQSIWKEERNTKKQPDWRKYTGKGSKNVNNENKCETRTISN